LNKIITNPNSPDTSLAGAYVSLSEILYISNLDTLKSLCEEGRKIAEKALKANTNDKTKKSLLHSLGKALNNIGYVYQTESQLDKALKYQKKGFEVPSLTLDTSIIYREKFKMH